MSSDPFFAPYNGLAAGPDGARNSFGKVVELVFSVMTQAANESVRFQLAGSTSQRSWRHSYLCRDSLWPGAGLDCKFSAFNANSYLRMKFLKDNFGDAHGDQGPAIRVSRIDASPSRLHV